MDLFSARISKERYIRKTRIYLIISFELAQLSLIPGNDYKIVFLPGEQFGELQPKPAGSARNQGNFSVSHGSDAASGSAGCADQVDTCEQDMQAHHRADGKSGDGGIHHAQNEIRGNGEPVWLV